MKQVIHQNYVTDKGKIFCKRMGTITELNLNNCNSCKFCVGSLQGQGVECMWEDEDKNYPILTILDPEKEKKRIEDSKQIQKSVKIEFKR